MTIEPLTLLERLFRERFPGASHVKVHTLYQVDVMQDGKRVTFTYEVDSRDEVMMFLGDDGTEVSFALPDVLV